MPTIGAATVAIPSAPGSAQARATGRIEPSAWNPLRRLDWASIPRPEMPWTGRSSAGASRYLSVSWMFL